MRTIIQRHLVQAAVCGGTVLALSATLAAQSPPPVNGTIALEGTVDQEYKAANTVIVKTMDGVRHLFHLTEKTAVHGADALRGVETGSRVVVHYTAAAGKQTALEVDRVDDKGLKTVEGVVTRVDRAARKMAIRLADGSEQVLRLTDRAATDVGRDIDEAADNATNVIVYYADETGERVAHYFKRIS
jgi:hypothetical protein